MNSFFNKFEVKEEKLMTTTISLTKKCQTLGRN
jgi:hypothetical protein